jgi:hypothetical protein
MGMFRLVLVSAVATLLPSACGLPESESFGEDTAAPENPGGESGAGNVGADDAGTTGQGDGANGGDASTGGSPDAAGSESSGGGVSTAGAIGSGGSVGTGGRLGTGGTRSSGGGTALEAGTSSGGANTGLGGGPSNTGGTPIGTGGEGGASDESGTAGAAGTTNVGPSIISIAAGTRHTCALMSDGTVKCWGYSSSYPGADPYGSPTVVPGITSAVALVASHTYTCVLLREGTVTCWGDSTEGELCTPEMCSESPTAITRFTNAVAISLLVEGLSAYSLCALEDNGTVECLSTESSASPVTITGLRNVRSIDAMCALLGDGTVTCWNYGSSESVAIAGIERAVSVSGSCALLNDATVTCWAGDPPDATTVYSWTADPPVPTTVEGVADVIDVADTPTHRCMVLHGGAVKCAGNDSYGQLGDGAIRYGYDSVLVDVLGLDDAIAVAVGAWHSCALLRGGGVKCWGENLFGQLGDGTTEDSSVPVTVRGL